MPTKMYNRKRYQNRRDRRKAKASNWRRCPTVKPKMVAHHVYESIYHR